MNEMIDDGMRLESVQSSTAMWRLSSEMNRCRQTRGNLAPDSIDPTHVRRHLGDTVHHVLRYLGRYPGTVTFI